MMSIVMRRLEGLDPRTRESIIANLERRLGHSIEEIREYERAFVERELRALLWIETGDGSYVTHGEESGSVELHKTAEPGTCPSCNEKGLISENGCSRCVSCGFGKCDV